MKSPGLAAVLSFFFCGLGQIYNGQIFKGIFMLVAYAVSWWMVWLVIGIFTTPILWIWGMVDAYRVAERIYRDLGMIAPFEDTKLTIFLVKSGVPVALDGLCLLAYFSSRAEC
jgi:TM2 domain-containing membrane protein YozV